MADLDRRPPVGRWWCRVARRDTDDVDVITGIEGAGQFDGRHRRSSRDGVPALLEGQRDAHDRGALEVKAFAEGRDRALESLAERDGGLPTEDVAGEGQIRLPLCRIVDR